MSTSVLVPEMVLLHRLSLLRKLLPTCGGMLQGISLAWLMCFLGRWVLKPPPRPDIQSIIRATTTPLVLLTNSANAAALATQERLLRTTLNVVDLGAEVVDGRANMEAGGVAGSGIDVAGQHSQNEEGMVDIPL
ncbi:hypothetical protein Dimus_003683 [Dionaea muscipula]